MNSNTTVTAVIGTGLVVTLGTWAEGKTLSVKPVVGGTFLALALTGIAAGSPDLAGRLALLILLVAMFRYALPILKKAGLTK